MGTRRDKDDPKSSQAIDNPPMSRLFIICNKSNTEDELRQCFETYGSVEEISVIRDRSNGENKGIAYIKFSKTSEAAKALEEMNGKCIGDCARPIKVLVAASRHQGSIRIENEQEKTIRLFVVISRETSEQELLEDFRRFGEVDYVTILRDKLSKESKGFAYVKFFRFTHAAIAFENCDKKYKAVFAEPRSSKSTETVYNRNEDNVHTVEGISKSATANDRATSSGFSAFMNPSLENGCNKEYQLNIICSKNMNQDQLWRLLDIVPGLSYCQINDECGNKSQSAVAAYNNKESAQYARDKIHGFEYPPGERIIIKFNGLADSVVGSKTVPEQIASSVVLPLPQPLTPCAPCVQRCFVVCVPKALPQKLLLDTFSRFGDLIDVYLLNNKNCGYVRYGSQTSARTAIRTLNGAEICGVRLKVMEAEEKRDDQPKRKRYNV